VTKLNDEEICEAVAAALTADGLPAESQYTGGGIWCVSIEEWRKPKASWLCGMSCENWAGQLMDDGTYCVYGEGNEEHILHTHVSSDSQDTAAIAGALARAVRVWRGEQVGEAVGVTASEMSRCVEGVVMTAANDAAANVKRVLTGIAEEIIAELQARPDVLDYYKLHAGTTDGPDFVFVEESASMRVTAAGLDADDEEVGDAGPVVQQAACAPVFAWLLREHNVQPPTWFLKATRAWR